MLQKELGQLANEDIERALNGRQDAKQITLLSILHRWGRNSPSGVHGHLQAWLQLAEAGAAHQTEKLAAQLMAYNRLLGPGLLDLWLEQTTQLASELSEAKRTVAVSGCSLLEEVCLEPASLSETHRLLQVLGACRARAAQAALQQAQGVQLESDRAPPPSPNLQVSRGPT